MSALRFDGRDDSGIGIPSERVGYKVNTSQQIAVAVAAYFIINPLHAASYYPETIWFVLDILMAVAAALALGFNTRRKLREGKPANGEPSTHRYWEANIAFYATIGVTSLLLHSWFSTLALDLKLGDHQSFVKWAVVDTLLPLVFGATGYVMWRGSDQGPRPLNGPRP